MNDLLLKALIELANELGEKNIPLVIGGGLSLYIRTTHLNKERSPRYKDQASQRSTKDIDIFLTSDFIITCDDYAKILRDTLTSLGYMPKTKYFQFEKEIESQRTIMVDILSPPIEKDDFDNKNIRIKIPGIDKFHARRNNEAKGVDIGLIPIKDLPVLREDSKLYIISSFNYIILKLHAFRDRIDDEEVDFGRYHAFDIFATVIDMDEDDWNNAKKHFDEEKDQFYIKSAIEIVRKYFNQPASMGITRLKENELYKRGKEQYNSFIDNFLSDIKEMFSL